jgi:hypothetical protein
MNNAREEAPSVRIGNREMSRREVERRIGDMGQLGGIRSFELVEGRARGVRCLEVDTGAGLRFTVVADRGLDVSDFSWKGTNLVYHAPGAMAHPAFYDPAGLEWLRVFFAGLFTTCGLTYFGSPGRDGGEDLGLHGRYSALPALRVNDLSRWEGDEYILSISGVVEECALFGDKLRLTRSISTSIGARSFRLHDRVENFGARPSPFTILYHVNPGFPLLDADSELLMSSASVEPYNAHSKDLLADVLKVTPPDPSWKEVNYLHDMAADGKGYARAALVNRNLYGGLGLSISFRTESLPYLSEWKMLNEGDYVVGMEPVNTKIANRAELRAAGRLPMLAPGEAREMDLEFGVLDGKAEIDAFGAEAARIRGK